MKKARNSTGPIKYNLKNAHYAMIEDDGSGNLTFGTPKAIPGSVSVTMDPDGEKTVTWADGGKYNVTFCNQGYSGSLEVALISDEFRKDVLGEKEDETAHVLLERTNAEPKPFALLFQLDKSNGTPILFAFYYCTASRVSVNSKTNTNTKEAQPDTLNLEVSPVEDNTGEEIARAKTTDKTPAAIRKNWFKQVWEPGSGLPGGMGTLTVISTEGTESGKTAVAVDPAKASGNIYRIRTGASVDLPDFGADCSGVDYQDWDGSEEIAAITGNQLLVVECTADGKAQSAGITTVASKE